MPKRDLLRLRVAQQALDHTMTVAQAAASLELSERQVKRLTRRLRLAGAEGFIISRKGKPPNNAFATETRDRVLELARTTYRGFGPTFLAEKLAELEHLEINRETLRAWLIAAQLHRPRRRRAKPRPMRERRSRFGELLQADGSPHRWFEDRAEPCTLLLCIDDATSKLMAGLFTKSETTDGYFQLFDATFAQNGLPMAVYTDKHSVFRLNQASPRQAEATQMQRALVELDVALICANSPQAKGRVERANRSLQDRLVKELRLAGISNIPEANAFLPGFIQKFNDRFAIAPRESEDAHRAVQPDALQATLIKKYDRALTKNLTFQIGDRIYAIEPSTVHRLHPRMRVDIRFPRDAEPYVVHNDRIIPTRLVGTHNRAAPVTPSKDLNAQIDRAIVARKAHLPPKDHPWRSQRPFTAQTAKGTSLNC